MIARTLSALVILLFAAAAQAQETRRQYLSGKGSDDAVPWEFMCTAGAKSGEWTTIPVPSCWDALGYGTLNYSHDKDAPEQGQYRHKFQVPADWRGQAVTLVFDGVMTDCQAKVNGQPAGPMHQGAFYRFSYDVTKLVKFGEENVLEVTVDKKSASAGINRAERQADYWVFGGIFRPVWLEAKPPQHVERIAIDARADGTIAIDVFGGGAGAADRVSGQVFDINGAALNGAAVGSAFSAKITDGKARLEGKIDAPRQWTAETPNLYVVEVALAEGDKVVHRVRQRFGFRTIEVRKGDGIYVNGKRVLLKGSNRHSFWPDSGRTTSEKLSRADVMLMKEMNHNAVRMSHYSPDEHFLDACDEIGLYVLDELAGWQKSYDEENARRLVGELIRRDVNHPSILFWDNGNEGGWNKAVDNEFAKWDPQNRAVLHPWELSFDVQTKHYRSYDEHVALCRGDVIYMPTEFLHGLFDGGAGAGLGEYWDAMRASKVGGGGFLWSFSDETVKRPDGKMDTAGNAAPDGIVGPYREKEGSFYTVKEIWSPIVARRVDDSSVEIDNRYDFTNARECTLRFELRRHRGPWDAQAGHAVVANWQQKVDIEPGQKRVVKLERPAGSTQEFDAIALRADDPTGRELWTWVWPVRAPQVATTAPTGGTVAAAEEGGRIKVTAGDLAIAFSKETGTLESAARGGKALPLTNGPRMAVGRSELKQLTHRTEGGDVIVEATYDGDMKRAAWRVRGDGWVELDYTYALDGKFDFFGVSFDLPEQDVKSMTWFGHGPFRTWKNRPEGATLGVWQNAFNDAMTGYSNLIYPEFKGYYSGVRWMRLETSAGPILAALDDPELHVQVLRPRFPGDPKPISPTTAATRRAPSSQLSGNAWAQFPAAGFSLLHAIPPIGSKFQLSNTTGPRGQQTTASGEYRGRAKFYFGQPPAGAK
ncbi:MAG TPA: glycoside hydrolase family 2 TIM barrel-domain containing protein [Tepidisphaeraceae bacterium]|nr:glycoside hydrolase family 2 TIM barrel-domain containing protein [Tepidisphaeraceae bacterium]